MNPKSKTSRRRLLQGLTGAALAYPFLRSIPSSAAEHPKRILFFFSPNDSVDVPYWKPQGQGAEYALPSALPPMLEALNPFRKKLLIIGNMTMDTRDKETGPGGHVGMGHQLTGWANRPWPNISNESEFWAGGISIDQHIAKEIGSSALTLAARPYGDANGGTRISYLGADLPVDPYEDPAAAWAATFGSPDLDPTERLAKNARQIRGLEHVGSELDRLRKKLPQEDRTKLDAHLTHLEKLETDLQNLGGTECNLDAPEGGYNFNSSSDYPITGRRQMDILANAVACGVTRVGSVQHGNTGNAENYSGGTSWPSENFYSNRSQHVISHDFEGDRNNAEFEATRVELEKFYMRQYAYLIGKLDAIPEGDGTVLDNTLVVWTKCMGRGHSKDKLLYMIAGGKGFPELRPGRYLDRPGVPHNNLLVTLGNLMDVDMNDTFGDPEICSGAMAL